MKALPFLLVLFLLAPDRPPPDKKPVPDPPLPVLSGPSRFGDITQDGRAFRISGRTWSGSGVIEKDGVLSIQWTMRGQGVVGFGQYHFNADDDSITGVWSWTGGAEIEGLIHYEVLREGKFDVPGP